MWVLTTGPLGKSAVLSLAIIFSKSLLPAMPPHEYFSVLVANFWMLQYTVFAVLSAEEL